MEEQHIKSISENNFVPKVGQRDLMCCNKKSLRCPSFGIKNPNYISKDVALDYFASILVEAFLDKKENEYNKLQSQTGGNIRPSIHKRTGG